MLLHLFTFEAGKLGIHFNFANAVEFLRSKLLRAKDMTRNLNSSCLVVIDVTDEFALVCKRLLSVALLHLSNAKLCSLLTEVTLLMGSGKNDDIPAAELSRAKLFWQQCIFM